MRQEPNMTAHVFDEELESKRAEIGKQSIPYNIISSLDGSDILFDHILFKSEVPIIINTSPKGFQIEKEDIEKIIIDNKNLGKIPVIVTGEGKFTDTNSLFKVLKYMGIDILLVEYSGVSNRWKFWKNEFIFYRWCYLHIFGLIHSKVGISGCWKVTTTSTL